MPNSYVTSAKITGGKIQLTVRVDDFKPEDNTAEYVEISGQATQTGGAFANFYDIKQVPPEPNVAADPKVSGDTSHYEVCVTGAPIPHQFKDEPVTVVMRVAKVWLTVLGKKAGVSYETVGTNGEGMTWDNDPRVAELTDGSQTPGP
jgi:hypothetical protein